MFVVVLARAMNLTAQFAVRLEPRFLDLDLSFVEYLTDKSLLALAEMLNDLCSLKNLLLAFKGCKSVTDSGVTAVVEGLPSVTLLKLDLAFCNISDETIESLASRVHSMIDLGVLHISFQGCQNISEVSTAHLVHVLPISLKGAKLNLCETPLPMNVQKLCRRLATMRTWTWTAPLRASSSLKDSKESKESKESHGPQEPPLPQDSNISNISNSVDICADKPGLALRSLDLFVRRGFVQEPRMPRSRPEASGRESLWEKIAARTVTSDEDEARLRRTFSEPYKRPLKALLPKVAHRAKGSSIASMANPECMFSRPRTTHSGFSEPVWYP